MNTINFWNSKYIRQIGRNLWVLLYTYALHRTAVKRIIIVIIIRVACVRSLLLLFWNLSDGDGFTPTPQRDVTAVGEHHHTALISAILGYFCCSLCAASFAPSPSSPAEQNKNNASAPHRASTEHFDRIGCGTNRAVHRFSFFYNTFLCAVWPWTT